MFFIRLNAYETSQITNISYTTCKKIFQKLRIYIYKNLLVNNTDYGEFEVDESYFGAKRIRGKRGRGAASIKSFWSFTKRRLAQFNGLRHEMFYLHINESEFDSVISIMISILYYRRILEKIISKVY